MFVPHYFLKKAGKSKNQEGTIGSSTKDPVHRMGLRITHFYPLLFVPCFKYLVIAFCEKK